MTPSKEEQKKLLADIMEQDQKNGLYKQQTAVEWLQFKINDFLFVTPAEERKLKDLFVQAKAMEAEQIINARVTAPFLPTPDSEVYKIEAEHYYNKTFKTQYK